MQVHMGLEIKGCSYESLQGMQTLLCYLKHTVMAKVPIVDYVTAATNLPLGHLRFFFACEGKATLRGTIAYLW